jgi:hypothetical protein
MAGEELLSIGQGIESILGNVTALVGSETSGSTVSSLDQLTEGFASSTAEGKSSGESRDRLDISDEAIDKIVSDILSGPDGLASIFAGEQNAGIFNSSVSAQAAGDLSSKITGEIAKLRAERIQTEDKTESLNKTQIETQRIEQDQRTDTRAKQKGLLNKIFGI